MMPRAWPPTHPARRISAFHPRRINMTFRPTKAVVFWFWLALATLLVGFISVGLRGKLTDNDRRAIELMLDRATP